MAQTALNRGDARTMALREVTSELFKMAEPRKRYAAIMSGLEIHYDLGPGHPLLGRRMPDLDVVTSDGPRRVYSFLRRARPLLLTLGEPSAPDRDLARALAPWQDRVPRVAATYAGAWELPMLGVVPAPSAVLIRPDGYVAWVEGGSEGADQRLRDALTTWFGSPGHPPK